MTICITSFTPTEILFASDTFRYFLKEGTIEDVLTHKLEINHTSLKDHIESYETNQPKIHKITKNMGLICGGDSRFADVTENLNIRKNIQKQITERLQQKDKLDTFWSCHIGRWHKGKAELTSIIYESGKITTKEHTKENITFDSFAPEMQKRFPFMPFYIANKQEKIKIINEFFKETTKLYNNLAGGTPKLAILNEKGFHWITTQNFTTYSFDWMPEKIETTSATTISWSSTDWTDILDLSFECESTMLIFGFVYCRVGDPNGAGLNIKVRDENDNYVPTTYGYFYTGSVLRSCYSSHFLMIIEKGTHHVKISIASNTSDVLVYAYDRRLSLLKGFYQGGTT
jgi:hypothetical protein